MKKICFFIIALFVLALMSCDTWYLYWVSVGDVRGGETVTGRLGAIVSEDTLYLARMMDSTAVVDCSGMRAFRNGVPVPCSVFVKRDLRWTESESTPLTQPLQVAAGEVVIYKLGGKVTRGDSVQLSWRGGEMSLRLGYGWKQMTYTRTVTQANENNTEWINRGLKWKGVER